MKNRPGNQTVVVLGLGVLAAMAVACGSQSSGKKVDGAGPGAGGAP
jgi:hypothetical protein